MAARPVKERLAQDIGQWLSDGLIGPKTAEKLRARWDQPGFGLAQVIKYISMSGALLVMFGLFGVSAAFSGSQGFAAVLLCAVGISGVLAGIRLTRDPSGRYAISSNVVLALGMLALGIGIGVLLESLGVRDEKLYFGTGLVTLPLAFYVAYRFHNTFLLTLGVLGAFGWVGTWTSMIGRSSYALSIEEPLTMCVAALLSIGVGIDYERKAQPAAARFHHVYQSLGLSYLNLSLLILTIDEAKPLRVSFIVVWALAAIAQIVVGARRHSALFTAFGVTALAINLYTRYFELFWKRMDVGLFFVIGGLLLFAFGFSYERRARGAA